MTAPDATLTGRLREALAHHDQGVVQSPAHGVSAYLDPECGCGEIYGDGLPAHLADVAAQTVSAWLREQREAVAEATRDGYYGTERGHDSTWDELTESGKGWWRDAADAALAALAAAIGGAE